MKKLKAKPPGGLPRGCLDPARLHFWGHSVWTIAAISGFKVARVHSDWSLTIRRHDKTLVRIPALVLCSRDRLHSKEYMQAAILGKPLDGIALELDDYDREFHQALKAWDDE